MVTIEHRKQKASREEDWVKTYAGVAGNGPVGNGSNRAERRKEQRELK